MAFSFLPKKILEMFSGALGSSDRVVGIDIGSSSIKMVQLRAERERAVLETYGELSVGAYHGQEGGRVIALSEEKAIEMIIDLSREAEVSAAKALVSVPLRYSFLALVRLPEMPEEDLASAVPFEARKYIPLPLSAVDLEWWPVSLAEEERIKERGHSVVLLAAMQKDVAERYRRSVVKAGKTVIGEEIEVFSSARSSIGKFRTPIMVVDIGASTTKITIVDYGSIRAAYNFEKGAQSLTVTLSQSLGIDFTRAEEMKRQFGVSSRPESTEMRRTILPFVDYILDEAERLRTYYRRESQRSVDKIIFVGGGSLLPGLVEYATERFGVEVILANPFQFLEYPTFMQPVMKGIAPVFSVAVGAALRALREARR